VSPSPAPPSPILLIAVPVFDHGETLRAVVCDALSVHDRVLVVDDGSTDGGAAALDGLPVSVVRHARNRGKGAAILTAAAEAHRMGATHIVTLDADGQFDPRDFPRFARAVQEDPGAIVVGRRDFRAARAPLSARLGRAFSNFWFRVQTGEPVGDARGGFRAYPVEVLELLKLREKRFSFEVEVLVKASWAGIPIREVEVSVRYPSDGQGVSHFNGITDNLRLAALNTWLTVRSMLPLPHRKIEGLGGGQGTVSVLHPWRSLRNLLAQNASPGELSAAVALGVFLGILPLIGVHTVGILFAAGFFRLNRWAALAAAQVGAPPLLPALCIEAGYYLRHGEFLTEVSVKTLGYQCVERFYEWFLGALVVAPLTAAAAGAGAFLMALAARKTLRAVRGTDREPR